jgi:hypothetical protein
MIRAQFCGAVAALIVGISTGALAQTAPKPGEQPGCTVANGVASGADCQQGGSDAAGTAVESGMPATQHQQEVLKTDDKAVKDPNMEATGTGGGMPATQHQQDVLKKPENGSDDAQQPKP